MAGAPTPAKPRSPAPPPPPARLPPRGGTRERGRAGRAHRAGEAGGPGGGAPALHPRPLAAGGGGCPLTAPPPPDPPAGDVLNALLAAGVPVVLWARPGGPGADDLPALVRDAV